MYAIQFVVIQKAFLVKIMLSSLHETTDMFYVLSKYATLTKEHICKDFGIWLVEIELVVIRYVANVG